MGIADVMAFVLILVRVGSMFAFLPFLGQGMLPQVVKALAAFVVSVVLFPVVNVGYAVVALEGTMQFFSIVAAEVLFGALLGFCAQTIFSSIRVGAEMIGQQMGMAEAHITDPIDGFELSVEASFCETVGILVFFVSGGHLWMLRAIGESFARWPVGAFVPTDFVREMSVTAAAESLRMGFQLAAPLLLVMFVVATLMAVMARVVPEINVWIVAFPLRVGVGLLGLALFVPLLVRFTAEVASRMIEYLSVSPAGA